MGDKFFLLIRQIGIFMICAQMLLHFKASESYGKYIRLLMSMMVLMQLALPIAGLLRQKSGEDFMRGLNGYEELFSVRMAEINQTCREAEAVLEAWTLDELRERMAEQEAAGQEEAAEPEAFGTSAQEEAEAEKKIEINRIEVLWHEE